MTDIRIRELEFPGIGRGFELPTNTGRSVLVIRHDGGDRHELVIRRPDVDEADCSVALSDAEAVALAGLLTGARIFREATEHEEDR